MSHSDVKLHTAVHAIALLTRNTAVALFCAAAGFGAAGVAGGTVRAGDPAPVASAAGAQTTPAIGLEFSRYGYPRP